MIREQDRRLHKQLLLKRTLVSVLTNVIPIFIVTSVLMLLSGSSPTHPLLYIEETWEKASSMRFWIWQCFLGVVLSLEEILRSRSFMSSSRLPKTRFQLLTTISRGNNLVICGLYMFICGFVSWLQLSHQRETYSVLTRKCENSMDTCFAEDNFLVFVCSLVMGLWLFVHGSILTKGVPEFPPIPETKANRVKMDILSQIPRAAVDSAWFTVYFLLFYYLLGHYLRAPALTLLMMPSKSQIIFTALIQPSLIFNIWTRVLLFKAIGISSRSNLEAHLTEWLSFNVEQCEVSSKMSLSHALISENKTILHLGFLDLFHVSRNKGRRSAMFKLSQPGGHPYNWNCVLEKTVNFLKKFVGELEAVTQSEKIPCPPVPSVVPQEIEKRVFGMRNMMLDKIPMDERKNKAPDAFNEYLRKKWQAIKNAVMSITIISYLFGERIEMKIRSVLLNEQAAIWAAESLSLIVLKSIEEDPFGIVQKDLPVIIETLLSLKTALDKFQKVNTIAVKGRGDDTDIKQTIAALKSATRRALYRITIGFKPYLRDLNLATTTIDQLQSFILTKE